VTTDTRQPLNKLVNWSRYTQCQPRQRTFDDLDDENFFVYTSTAETVPTQSGYPSRGDAVIQYHASVDLCIHSFVQSWAAATRAVSWSAFVLINVSACWRRPDSNVNYITDGDATNNSTLWRSDVTPRSVAAALVLRDRRYPNVHRIPEQCMDTLVWITPVCIPRADPGPDGRGPNSWFFYANKLSYCRESAWCFMSVNILLSHSRSFEVTPLTRAHVSRY